MRIRKQAAARRKVRALRPVTTYAAAALFAAVFFSLLYWCFATFNSRAIDRLVASVEDARPVISFGFDVYLDGNRLVYVKEECGDEDVDAEFFLRLYPVDGADLPEPREPHGFDDLGFFFGEYGRRGGGRCVVVRVLPEYEIASMHTGQYRPGREPAWSGIVGLSAARPVGADAWVVDELIAGVEDARPVVSGVFDVYLDGNRLVYVKEECGAEDVDAGFFLHLHPVDEADLPEPRRPHGFDELDFVFETHGRRTGGRCAAARVLPEYRIASVRTGQRTPGQDAEWSGSVGFPVSWSFATAKAVDELIAGVEDARPVVAGGFDVHLDGNRLVYVKEECGDGDVAAEFFLHLRPVDAADLPDSRRPHGFDELDFVFETHGRRAGGRCAAVRVLPEYRIASIRTGRYGPGPGRDPEWSGRFSPADLRLVDELIASVEDARPIIIGGGFGVYLDGGRLVYVKEECGAEDVDGEFFLHLRPADEADLPDSRRPHGFDDLGFVFETHGRRAGGRCAAARTLPGYEIASIDAGRRAPGRDSAWSGRFSFEDSRLVDDLLAGVEDARPIIASGFDVYLDGDRLVYVKEECGAEDVDARFFLHVYPVEDADLPELRKPRGFNNFDFDFETNGRRADGRCAAVRALPEYGVARIDTGQYAPGQDPEWIEIVDFPVSWSFATARAVDELIAGVAGAQPVVSGVFDVYRDGNRLVYVKEECGYADTEAEFFLHLYPFDEADLSDLHRQYGYDNLGFVFEAHGRRAGGRCAAVRVLPEYGIASINTGQYVPGRDPEWSGWVSPVIDELMASVEDARPVVSGVFDVYLDGNRLVYVKEECRDEDVDAGFFLHLYPFDEADLPEPRKPHGFDNLDFAFETHGFRADGRCAAARVLPEYRIVSVHTGQYVPGQGPEWGERVGLAPYSP